MAFKEIEHTADYAIHIEGADIIELFTEAARGMNALAGGKAGPPYKVRTIEIDAFDLESLLVAWLEELAFIMEVENEIASAFIEMQVMQSSLHARIETGRVHGLNKLIKAVTFHDMAIRPVAGGYETTVVFDV